MDASLAIYFEYNDDRGGRLKDKNGKYVSTAGDVAVYKSIRPAYDPALYGDLQVFMPYSELDLNPGKYNLNMDVDIIYKEGGLLQHMNMYEFDYTKPESTTGTTTTVSKQASATYSNLWVDYDVTENGLYGMRIHVKFTTLNMKDVDSYLAVYFEMKNGEKLFTNNMSYRSKAGQVAVYKTLKPAYEESVYNDAQVFMPYNELNLGKGKFDLRLVADVIYKNGDLVTRLKKHEFQFEQ